jgi:hypothetical protein
MITTIVQSRVFSLLTWLIDADKLRDKPDQIINHPAIPEEMKNTLVSREFNVFVRVQRHSWSRLSSQNIKNYLCLCYLISSVERSLLDRLLHQMLETGEYHCNEGEYLKVADNARVMNESIDIIRSNRFTRGLINGNNVLLE